MVDVKELRGVLWADAESLTDEEIQRVVDLLKWVCRIWIDDYFNSKCAKLSEDTETIKED